MSQKVVFKFSYFFCTIQCHWSFAAFNINQMNEWREKNWFKVWWCNVSILLLLSQHKRTFIERSFSFNKFFFFFVDMIWRSVTTSIHCNRVRRKLAYQTLLSFECEFQQLMLSGANKLQVNYLWHIVTPGMSSQLCITKGNAPNILISIKILE